MKTISDYEMPLILKDYFSYIQTIKGKSENTIKVYFFDLRVFFRFLKLHKNLANKNTEFDNIDICDVDIGLIKDVTLSDLYAFMSYVSNRRDNSSHAR
ncbi:MAG TPA: recombinase XerC, partial [Clostridia bacterium]